MKIGAIQSRPGGEAQFVESLWIRPRLPSSSERYFLAMRLWASAVISRRWRGYIRGCSCAGSRATVRITCTSSLAGRWHHVGAAVCAREPLPPSAARRPLQRSLDKARTHLRRGASGLSVGDRDRAGVVSDQRHCPSVIITAASSWLLTPSALARNFWLSSKRARPSLSCVVSNHRQQRSWDVETVTGDRLDHGFEKIRAVPVDDVPQRPARASSRSNSLSGMYCTLPCETCR